MYGMYYDYYGYDRVLMCVCDTIIECKKAFFDNCECWEDYKEYFNEYTIVKLEKNKWQFFSKPLDSGGPRSPLNRGIFYYTTSPAFLSSDFFNKIYQYLIP